jgi:hypothetical protein
LPRRPSPRLWWRPAPMSLRAGKPPPDGQPERQVEDCEAEP